MGSHPWWCHTDYKEPLQATLQELRHREFLKEVAADPGEYNSEEAIEAGIAEYIEVCDADGTCSILDVDAISSIPEEFDYGCACPLSEETLIEMFGTSKPAKAALHGGSNLDEVYELLERGQACYIIAYEDDKPVELHFCGMSYD